MTDQAVGPPSGSVERIGRPSHSPTSVVGHSPHSWAIGLCGGVRSRWGGMAEEEIPALGCWYPVAAVDDIIVLCREPGSDEAHGLCAEHAWRVLGARRLRAMARSR